MSSDFKHCTCALFLHTAGSRVDYQASDQKIVAHMLVLAQRFLFLLCTFVNAHLFVSGQQNCHIFVYAFFSSSLLCSLGISSVGVQINLYVEIFMSQKSFTTYDVVL